MSTLELPATVSLTDLPLHTNARVHSVQASNDLSERLEALGLCAGRVVRLVKAGEPCIVRVYGTRVGLTKRLAQLIHVVPSGE